MNAEAPEQLRKLAAYLETVVAERNFYMGHFYSYAYWATHRAPNTGWAVEDFREEVCSTTACAWGYAPRVLEGVELVSWDERQFDHPGAYWRVHGRRFLDGFRASEAFFGISSAESLWLFDPMTYVDPMTYGCTWPTNRAGVALRLRVFADNGGIPDDDQYSSYAEVA